MQGEKSLSPLLNHSSGCLWESLKSFFVSSPLADAEDVLFVVAIKKKAAFCHPRLWYTFFSASIWNISLLLADDQFQSSNLALLRVPRYSSSSHWSRTLPAVPLIFSLPLSLQLETRGSDFGFGASVLSRRHELKPLTCWPFPSLGVLYHTIPEGNSLHSGCHLSDGASRFFSSHTCSTLTHKLTMDPCICQASSYSPEHFSLCVWTQTS